MPTVYQAKPPRPLRPTEALKRIWKSVSLSLSLLLKLLRSYEPEAQEPELPFPGGDETLDPRQRELCREIFDLEEARIQTLEQKASALFATVVVLVPLCLGALSLMWRNTVFSSDSTRVAFFLLCGFSLVSLLGAVLAVFRIRNVAAYQAPGVDAIIDQQEGSRRPYDIERDAYCLLLCATVNHAAASLRFDFLRAGQALVSAALMFLVLAAVPLAVASWETGMSAPGDHALEERVERLERELLAPIPPASEVTKPSDSALPSGDNQDSHEDRSPD